MLIPQFDYPPDNWNRCIVFFYFIDLNSLNKYHQITIIVGLLSKKRSIKMGLIPKRIYKPNALMHIGKNQQI